MDLLNQPTASTRESRIITFSIRQTDDLDDIQRMDAVCLPGAKDSLAEYLDDATWWIATAHGVPAAYCGIVADEAWESTGYLCRAGVLPEFRGQGLQKRLIRVREAHARRMDWTHCISDTTSVYSANNLIACGYRLYRPKEPWAWSHSMYFIKRL